MPRPMLFAVDPRETWEIDLCLERARGTVKVREARLEALKAKPDAKPEEVAVAETRLTAAKADLESYVPGAGPCFTLGHLPPLKAAEAEAVGGDVEAAGDRKSKATTDLEWQRVMVRYGVRGHRNLLLSSGAEVPFQAETEQVDGEPCTAVSRATLDVYAASRILAELALHVASGKRLEESEKNV